MKVEEAGLRIRPWGLNTAKSDLGGMTQDAVFMIRRAAYVDEIRSVARRARWMGWATLAAGGLLLAWALISGLGADSGIGHYGEAAICLGGLLFFYVMFQRTRYVRANPFNPRR